MKWIHSKWRRSFLPSSSTHLLFFIYESSLSTKIFSGVAGIIVALSCCAAVGKLGYRRTCCPLFTFSIEDALVELMDLSHSLVSVDKLHHLATEAGFEMDLLTHFGTKVFPSKRSEELEFWIGLAHKKLSVAFQKENMFSGRKIFRNKVHSWNNVLIFSIEITVDFLKEHFNLSEL